DALDRPQRLVHVLHAVAARHALDPQHRLSIAHGALPFFEPPPRRPSIGRTRACRSDYSARRGAQDAGPLPPRTPRPRGTRSRGLARSALDAPWIRETP